MPAATVRSGSADMIVAELIEKLKGYDPEQEVVSEVHYNDEQGGVSWHPPVTDVYTSNAGEVVVGF